MIRGVDLFDVILRESEKVMNDVVKNTFKAIDDFSEEELKKALDKKLAEKQQQVLHLETLKAKVKPLFRDDVVLTVETSSSDAVTIFKFSQRGTGAMGSAVIRFDNR